MNRLLLENKLSYIIVADCVYNDKKYLYLINEDDNTDIKIVEMLNNSVVNEVMDSELLRKVIKNYLLFRIC